MISSEKDILNMASVVQIYIHVRKGIEVQINLVNLNMRNYGLLVNAYGIASSWLADNNAKIKSI